VNGAVDGYSGYGLGSLEWVAASQEAGQVEAIGFGLQPGGVDVLLAAFLAGDGAQGVLGQEARAFLAELEVPGKEFGVVLHLADLIQLLEDGFLGQGHDLDGASVEAVDRDRDGEFDVGGAGAATAFAGFEVAHLNRYIFVGWLVEKPEGLGFAVGGGAPGFVKLKGFVGEEGEADRAAVGEFGDLQVAAARASAGDGG
jgi:hypothetical protein